MPPQYSRNSTSRVSIRPSSRAFAKDYGTLIASGPLAGISARAVLTLDENDSVVHAQLVPEIAEEPDYDAALAALEG